MRYISIVIFLFIALFILLSCDKKNNSDLFQRLSYWNSMVDSVPQLVSDSLQSIDVNDLSRAERAFWGLLKVISDDKSYVNFTDDSLINAVCNYYSQYEPGNPDYIKALAYQGIVRTRMGVKDSTVYEPLREADRLLQLTSEPDPSVGYLVNYFLGNIHYNNRNYASAEGYFQHTLNYAHLEKDSTHLFDTYLALYWNEMEREKFDEGKLYLDTLSSFYKRLPGKDYFILNAQSVYYDIIGEPEKALEREKRKLGLFGNQEERIELSRVYYNISFRYIGMELLDSAMLYAQKAINCIQDTTQRQNYLYYQNVANIAEKQGDYNLSNQYLRSAFDLYNKSVSDRLDTQIAELEKKYDLSEAENEILRTKQQNLRIIISALVLAMVVIFILMYAWKVRRTTRLKLMNAEYKMQQQELQAQILREEAGKRKWLLQLYNHIAGRLAFLQGEIQTLSQRYISSHPKIYREIEMILKKTDTDLKDITKTLATDNETFFAYTHLKDDESFFNATERMLLMLLSCDADNRQLATFMNTSLESIRVRKSQLKRKMQGKNMDTTLFNE